MRSLASHALKKNLLRLEIVWKHVNVPSYVERLEVSGVLGISEVLIEYLIAVFEQLRLILK